ncbi:unnamed protein product [Caenorhabditis bovis]|uniref:Apoptosis regulator Bcl-2 family BH4 domain-containing protein n=1 Tax=Caenorhabditis bovis TaxID=2654633 RepID=A0A8S1EKJ1_9PELO|nr:unnamed protein product [Caenorhabditis bovis]
MTRDNATPSCSQETFAFRRRTMATGDIKELLSSGSDPMEHDGLAVKHEEVIVPMPTRRMSIGNESCARSLAEPREINDWELERLDIEGFVVDYFTFRIRKEGLEWYDAPELPYGTQPEHEVMRCVASVFEEKNSQELEKFAEQLMASPKVTFSVYQEIVQSVGFSASEACPMSYGRLVGLLSFGGLVASKMISHPTLREQVRNMAVYTSLFIKSRIRSSWKEHKKTWAGFMELGVAVRDKKQNVANAETMRKSRRRWSVYGMTAAAVAVFSIVVGGRMILSGASIK